MIFDRWFSQNVLSTYRNPSQALIEFIGGQKTAAGVAVNEESAMTYSGVWAATRALTDGIATLPCVTYRRRTGRKGQDKAIDHRLYHLLHDEPNPEMDSCAFWGQQAPFLINSGNCYAEIGRTRGGAIASLWPLKNSDVTIDRRDDGQIEYGVKEGGGKPRPVAARDMFHVTGLFPGEGILGKGVISHARESIAMGMATEQFGAAFFGNGCRPGGLLTSPKQLSDVAYGRLLDWKKRHGGVANAHKLGVLEEDTKYQAIGIPPEEAQFLETRQHNITEIARWYGLPPHVLGDLVRATFSNIEEMGLNLVIHSFRPWWVRIEKAMHRQLLTEAEKPSLFMGFNGDALLRGDTTARTESHRNMFGIGARSINEILQIEDENEIGSDGDRRLIPMNMLPLDRIDDYVDSLLRKAGGGAPGPGDDEAERNAVDIGTPEEFAKTVASEVIPPVRQSFEAMVQQASHHEARCEQRHVDEVAGQADAANELMKGQTQHRDALTSTVYDASAVLVGEVRTLADEVRPVATFAEEHGKAYVARTCADVTASITVAYLRMLSVESNHTLRLAKDPRRFLDRLEAFWDKHRHSLANALRAQIAAYLSVMCLPLDASDVAAEVATAHIDESRQRLLTVCECQPCELVDRVAACVAEWDTRRPLLPEISDNDNE